MFKKVIGQDLNDPSRQNPPAPAAPAVLRRPEAAQPVAPQQPQPMHQAPAQAAAAARPAIANTRNILSTDVEIKGTIKFTNDLLVDGKVDGEIHSDGNLTVGENARLKAEIKTATVVVYGKIQGNITASDRVELRASAEVVGDIKTKTLSIEAGAVFVGRSTVGTPAQPVAKPANQPAAPAQQAAPQGNKPQPAPNAPTGNPPKQPNLPGAV